MGVMKLTWEVDFEELHPMICKDYSYSITVTAMQIDVSSFPNAITLLLFATELS